MAAAPAEQAAAGDMDTACSGMGVTCTEWNTRDRTEDEGPYMPDPDTTHTAIENAKLAYEEAKFDAENSRGDSDLNLLDSYIWCSGLDADDNEIECGT